MLVVAPEEAAHDLIAVEQSQEPAVTQGQEGVLWSQLQRGRAGAWWLSGACALPVTNHICISASTAHVL